MHRPVLVTGASSGIGEAIAVHLAQKGFTVFAGARRVDKLMALSGLGGGRIRPVALDVTDPESISAAMDVVSKDGAPLFGLVNNAGVSVVGPVEETPLDEWRRVFETNVFGMVAMTQAVLPIMRESGSGRIVNIGSVAGRVTAPFFGPYGASKHAVEGLTDALRRELTEENVKVSLIRPGFINTSFGEQEQASMARYKEEGHYTERMERFAAWHARGHPNGAPATLVAEKVHDALTATRPHSRYTAPAKMIPYLMVRNLAPSAIADRLFARTVGVKRR